jgi:hypothetical protein
VATIGGGLSRGQSLAVDVLVKDTAGSPVQSTISKVVDIAKPGTPIALTSKDGQKRISCDAMDTIRAEPVGKQVYFWSEPQPCKSPATFVVPFTEATMLSRGAADHYSQAGQPAKAAILYNDLAVRFQKVDSGKSQEFGRMAYEQVAKALNVSAPTVLDAGRTVMSSELQDAVKQVQGASNIKQTGKLDFPTLSVLANKEDGKAPGAALSLKGIAAAASAPAPMQ